jgi:aminopeptidase N
LYYSQGDIWRSDFGPPAAPRSATNVLDLFNPNVYYGGATALYALKQVVGERTFYEIERRWVRTYEGESASTADFITLASRVARRNLGPFLRAWLYGATTPAMPGHPDWTVDPPTEAAARVAPEPSAASLERLSKR